MGKAIVGDTVGCDGEAGIRLVDVVIDGAVAVVVVGGAAKAPGVAGVAAGIGVRGATDIDRTHSCSGFTIDAVDGGDAGRVGKAIVGDAVGCVGEAGIRLVDVVIDGAVTVVVVGGAGKAPGVAGVAAGIGGGGA